jgi:hypothetical protein
MRCVTDEHITLHSETSSKKFICSCVQESLNSTDLNQNWYCSTIFRQSLEHQSNQNRFIYLELFHTYENSGLNTCSARFQEHLKTKSLTPHIPFHYIPPSAALWYLDAATCPQATKHRWTSSASSVERHWQTYNGFYTYIGISSTYINGKEM